MRRIIGCRFTGRAGIATPLRAGCPFVLPLLILGFPGPDGPRTRPPEPPVAESLGTESPADPARIFAPDASPGPRSEPEVLRRAVERQETNGLPATIGSLEIRSDVILREKDRIEADLHQWWRVDKEKERFLSVLIDKSENVRVAKAFDGRGYWLRETRRRKTVTERRLRGREDRVDIESINDEIVRIHDTIRFFFLRTLLAENARFEPVPVPDEGAVAFRRTHPLESEVVLVFDESEARLLRAHLPAFGDEPETRFEFSGRLGKVTVAGERVDLYVPRSMLVFQGERELPVHDFFLNEVRINGEIPIETFAFDPD